MVAAPTPTATARHAMGASMMARVMATPRMIPYTMSLFDYFSMILNPGEEDMQASR